MTTKQASKKKVRETNHKSFQASVGKLLDIVAHALYSEREVFLRELISNAADACARLRFRAIENPALLGEEQDFCITLKIDKDKSLLEISDNGEGMDAEQLEQNLGTIARSGTEQFLQNLDENQRNDSSLIGQFGVGFYSSFMVAEHVEVLSRAAGEEHTYRWQSNGKESYSLDQATDDGARGTHGTTIRLTLKKDASEFLEKQRISHIVKTYSNHISIPVVLQETDNENETLNTVKALWWRAPSEVSEEEYQESYRHHAHAFDTPFETIHARIEGMLEYAALLFVPNEPLAALFDQDRDSKLKLYVNRVFITDQCAELLPGWLRFVRGVVDSQDLPLNVSRELVQKSPILAKIKKELTKRVLNALKAKATQDPESYNNFFDKFGAVLKEGLYEDPSLKESLLPLCRFKTSLADTPMSIDDYVAAMPTAQKAIYYISGDSLEAIKASPQLEGLTKRGFNVLCLTDPVDDFWLPMMNKYQDYPIQSITRGDLDLDGKADTLEDSDAGKDNDDTLDQNVQSLLTRMKEVLGDDVSEVKISHRLDSSPACFVATEGAMDKHLEKMLMAHHRIDSKSSKIMEINPDHPLIKKLANAKEADADHIWLLFDQTRIVEGEPPKDAKAFAERLSALL